MTCSIHKLTISREGCPLCIYPPAALNPCWKEEKN
jgi:hypothetical protein